MAAVEDLEDCVTMVNSPLFVAVPTASDLANAASGSFTNKASSSTDCLGLVAAQAGFNSTLNPHSLPSGPSPLSLQIEFGSLGWSTGVCEARKVTWAQCAAGPSATYDHSSLP